MKGSSNLRAWVAAVVAALFVLPALAWDAAGHRMITWLALDGLSADAPEFLRDPAVRHAVGWQSAEPDRWRGVRSAYLMHENAPDHFLDIEDLEKYGLTIGSLPKLRYQYVAAMAVQRHVHPDQIPPHNPKLDSAGQQEWPGFLPYAIVEHHAKLISAFKTYRTLVKLDEPAREPQLAMARRNIMVEMGLLAHFVGDAAQPLHTTKHYNGWVGENPDGFTTAKTFHAYIDGGLIRKAKIDYAMAKPTQKYEITIEGTDPWDAVIAHITRSHDQMKRLYELEKAGTLDGEEGKSLVVSRLNDGAAMLAALYNHAWKSSVLTDKDVTDFVRYDTFDPKEVPGEPASPAAKPPASK